MLYYYDKVRFEWNSEKNAANWSKHEVEFEAAAKVFNDENYVLLKDRIVKGSSDGMPSARSLSKEIRSKPVRSYYWLCMPIRRKTMAKKSSVSSRRGKLISVSAGSIANKPLSDRQMEALRQMKSEQDAGDGSGIDYSDIPALTEKQIAGACRPARKLVAVRLDADVLEWLRGYGAGYSTRINHILRAVMNGQNGQTPG